MRSIGDDDAAVQMGKVALEEALEEFEADHEAASAASDEAKANLKTCDAELREIGAERQAKHVSKGGLETEAAQCLDLRGKRDALVGELAATLGVAAPATGADGRHTDAGAATFGDALKKESRRLQRASNEVAAANKRTDDERVAAIDTLKTKRSGAEAEIAAAERALKDNEAEQGALVAKAEALARDRVSARELEQARATCKAKVEALQALKDDPKWSEHRDAMKQHDTRIGELNTSLEDERDALQVRRSTATTCYDCCCSCCCYRGRRRLSRHHYYHAACVLLLLRLASTHTSLSLSPSPLQSLMDNAAEQNRLSGKQEQASADEDAYGKAFASEAPALCAALGRPAGGLDKNDPDAVAAAARDLEAAVRERRTHAGASQAAAKSAERDATAAATTVTNDERALATRTARRAQLRVAVDELRASFEGAFVRCFAVPRGRWRRHPPPSHPPRQTPSTAPSPTPPWTTRPPFSRSCARPSTPRRRT